VIIYSSIHHHYTIGIVGFVCKSISEYTLKKKEEVIKKNLLAVPRYDDLGAY